MKVKAIAMSVACGVFLVALNAAQAEECFTNEVNGTTFSNCIEGKPIPQHGVEGATTVINRPAVKKAGPETGQQIFEFHPGKVSDRKPDTARGAQGSDK